MRKGFFIGIGVLLVAAIVGVLYQFAASRTSGAPQAQTISGALAQESIVINGHTIIADIADTPAAQQQGLGRRSGLDAEHGMLFVFPSDEYHAFWMKDMRFSIDMVWLSADGHVVAIQENVAPETFPEVFNPHVLSRYVLELKADAVKALPLRVGDAVVL